MNIRIRVDLIRLEKYLIQRNIRQSHSQPYRQHHIYIYNIYKIYNNIYWRMEALER